MNWDDFKFIDLFAGIGGIRLGFESVGGPAFSPQNLMKMHAKLMKQIFMNIRQAI